MKFEVIFVLLLLWIITLIANVFLIKILEGRNLNYSHLVDKELVTLILLCIFSPLVLVFMILAVVLKFSIGISNIIPEVNSQKVCKDCTICEHRCHNECLFFKLTIKPKMMCKGRFFVLETKYL